MSDMLTCLCPNCGSKLVYGKGDKTVMCFACDSSMSIEELTGNSGASMAAGASMSTGFGGAVAPAMAMIGFDNPESGVVFIENFFETYNWVTYAVSSEITIPEIAEVIANNKMKNGASPLSWYLDYKGLAYPLRKKIEGLSIHQQLIGEKYNPIDSSEAYTAFDSYRRICKALTAEKAAIFKQLDTAVKYAEKFALDSEKLNEIKNDLVDLKSLFEKHVKVVKEITDIPAYVEAKNAANRKKAAELAQAGIDAEATYQKALAIYNSADPNKSSALKLFESIRGYSDSVEFIDKINQYFNFNDKMYRFFGKHFIYKEEDYTPTLDLKSLGKKALKKAKAQQSEDDSAKETKALSLYEVVDGVPAEEALIKGIDKIIDCYGSRFYYFKMNEGIYCFDIYKKEETIVDSGKTDDYKNADNNYEFGYSKSGSSFYVKKKVPAAAPLSGCMSNFKKKKATEDPVLNPYCVILIDMATNSSRTIISQFLEIAQHHEDKLFYKFAYKPEKAKSGCLKPQAEPETKTRLMVCDVAKGTSKQVLDEDCEIHTVHKDYIVYSLWKPNRFNRDLHVYDIENSKDTLIEPNIFNFFDIIDGKLYYTVGNEDYCPLVRSSFSGEGREEIMANVENIVGERGGWMYVKKGRGRNSVLVKVSSDGKVRQLLCTQFKNLCRFEDSYVYYVDTYNTLRVVRIDGKENRKLAENVTKVFPSDNGLFYVRDEQVGESRRDTALSLYKMDKEGRNVRKIVFNVDYVQNDPKTNTLYFSKAENMRFKEYEVGKEDKAIYAFHDIEKFYRMDKDAERSELILTLGLPEAPETGCLKKKKKQMVYQEAPIRQSYASKGLVAEDENEEDTIVEDQPALPSFLPAGCASILNAGKGLVNKGKSGSTPKAASANKGKSSKNAKLKLPKFSPISLLTVLVVLALFSGCFAFLGMRIDAYGYPEATEIIIPLVLCAVAAFLGLLLLGILPFGNLKQNKPIGILAILAAVLYLVCGVWGLFALPGKGDTPGKAIELSLNDSETVKLSNYNEQYYTFTPSKSGLYNLSVEDNNANYYVYCYIYTDFDDEYTGSSIHSLKFGYSYGGYSDSKEGGNVHAVDLTANTTYLFAFNYSYDEGCEFDFKVTEHPRLNATALTPETAYVAELSTSTSRDLDYGEEMWIRFTPTEDGTYYFSASTNYDNINVYAYADPTDEEDEAFENATSHLVKVELTANTNYYFKVTSNTSTYVSYTVLTEGTNWRTAYEATYDTDYEGTFEGSSYVWYKYTAVVSGYHTITVVDDTSSNYCYAYLYLYSDPEDSSSYSDTSYSDGISINYYLTEGETYYFQVYQYSTSTDSFTLNIALPEDGSTILTAYKAVSDTKYSSSLYNSEIWYKYKAVVDGEYTIDTTSSYDMDLYLYDSIDGSAIESENGMENTITYTMEKDKMYYFKVSYAYYDTNNYTFKITPPQDGLTAATGFILELDGDTLAGTVDSETIVWYKFTPEYTYYYKFNVQESNSNYVYLYKYDSATASSYSDYTYGSNFSYSSWYLTAGTTYYFKVAPYYSGYTCNYSINVSSDEDGSYYYSAFKVKGQSSNGYSYWSTTINSSANTTRWYKLIAPESGTYTFTLSSSGSSSYYKKYFRGYSDPTGSYDNGSSSTVSSYTFNQSLTKGEVYYVYVNTGSYSYYSSTISISGPGLSYYDAISLSYETEQEITIPKGGYVWLKYTPDYSNSGNTHYVKVSGAGYTTTYVYEGTSTSYYNYANGNSYNVSYSMSSSYTYYIRVYSEYGATVKVSVSTNSD